MISNSLKYNTNIEELKIYFELIKDGDDFIMNYRDNGKGYPDGQFEGNEKGMGYTIISSLTRQLFAESSTFNDKGAHFKMKFGQKKISPL